MVFCFLTIGNGLGENQAVVSCFLAIGNGLGEE